MRLALSAPTGPEAGVELRGRPGPVRDARGGHLSRRASGLLLRDLPAQHHTCRARARPEARAGPPTANRRMARRRTRTRGRPPGSAGASQLCQQSVPRRAAPVRRAMTTASSWEWASSLAEETLDVSATGVQRDAEVVGDGARSPYRARASRAPRPRGRSAAVAAGASSDGSASESGAAGGAPPGRPRSRRPERARGPGREPSFGITAQAPASAARRSTAGRRARSAAPRRCWALAA